MVTLHFFVGTFFCLVPNTIEQQSSSPISGPCNVGSPLVGRNDKVLLRFSTNLVANVCRMTSVEGPALNYYIFNVSWRLLFVVPEISGQPDILKMFILVATGYLRPFPFQVVHNSHCCGLLKHKIRWILPLPALFKKALFQCTKLVYSLSISIWCCYRFYFFVENVFYIFILLLMSSYRALSVDHL